MLRLATTFALASLSLAVIQPMGVVGKANSSTPGLVVHVQATGDSILEMTHGAGILRRYTCGSGEYHDDDKCKTCPAGYYCPGETEDRKACPAGTYNDKTGSSRSSACKEVQCGYKASGRQKGDTAETGQTPCGVGYYSEGKTATWTPCPKGSYCNSQTTCEPSPCDPGTYADKTGSGQKCKNCPAGTFNNSYGSTSCCKCCAGWFSQGDNVHTNCERCANIGSTQSSGVSSTPGSTSQKGCHVYENKKGQYEPATTCSQAPPTTKTAGTCPAEIGTSGTMAISRRAPTIAMSRRTTTQCYFGKTRCEVKGGRGGFECVDTKTSLETCGGCDNDCSTMTGTNEVGCVKGHCVVKSCANGYALTKRGDGVSRGGLDVDQHCVAVKKRHVRHASAML